MQFARKDDLTSLKPDVDKLEKAPSDLNILKRKEDNFGFDKLTTVLVDLSKLSNVVNNDVIKTYLYNAD